MANLITLVRIPLLAFITYLLYQPRSMFHYIAATLIVVLIFMDFLDGMVARTMKRTSVLGSVLDIAADRTVEQVLWVVFADLGFIPIIIPLVVIARGVFVDAIRSVAPSKGLAPFDLLHSPIAKFIVKSPWLRSPYGIAKTVAFVLLAIYSGLETSGTGVAIWFGSSSQIAVWIAFFLCIVRALPVIIEAPQTLAKFSE